MTTISLQCLHYPMANFLFFYFYFFITFFFFPKATKWHVIKIIKTTTPITSGEVVRLSRPGRGEGLGAGGDSVLVK